MLWPHYDTGSRSINRAIDRGVNRNYLTVRRISVSCASLFHNKKYTAALLRRIPYIWKNIFESADHTPLFPRDLRGDGFVGHTGLKEFSLSRYPREKRRCDAGRTGRHNLLPFPQFHKTVLGMLRPRDSPYK